MLNKMKSRYAGKKIILNITFVSLILYTAISCNKNSIIPPGDDQPGRRDYVWSVDTLDTEFNIITGIWGSSPQDVWATGSGGTENDRLWHFDGDRWTAYNKDQLLGGGETLYGFDANNVWMGGRGITGSGTIWQYNGSNWVQNFTYNVEGATDVTITNIWGLSQSDVYACGNIYYNNDGKNNWLGFVLHYNGSTWQEVVKADFNSQFLRIRKEQDKVFVFSYALSDSDETIEFYEVKYNQLNRIYSNSTKNGLENFEIVKENLYFIISNDIDLYRNNTFVKQFSIENPNFRWGLWGRNEKDIFLGMSDGVLHYNGTDFQYLINFPTSISTQSSILFEEEAFFAIYLGATAKNVVLHGKLKE